MAHLIISKMSRFQAGQDAQMVNWLLHGCSQVRWVKNSCCCEHTQPYPLEPDCEFVGQIGNGGVDHGFWGRPEEMTMNRFLLLMNILSFKIPANLAGLLIQHLKIWSFLTLSNVAGLHTAFPVTTLAPIWRVGLQLTFTGIFALDFFMCNFLSFC